jgi:short-subunit dehydrogenase
MEKVKPAAIIIGASSGIGRALAKELHNAGYRVGVSARRTELLEELATELGANLTIRKLDVTKTDESHMIFSQMAEELGRVDLVVISAGTGAINPELDWAKEEITISTNVLGFTRLADSAMNFFMAQGYGHLVGISSIAALRGNSVAPAYNASKAFVSNYLEGLRMKAFKQNPKIQVTDIRPGFVDTAMAQGEGLFWVASPEKAARQIYNAIKSRKKVAYITRRWRLIAWLMQLLPDFLIYRM